MFTAKNAEDFCLTKGTAETLDDLMLLKGYREYRLIAGAAEKDFNKYVENWRRSFENANNALIDFGKHMSWATGEDTIKYLGRAKSDLQRVLAAIKRYDAVRVRLEQVGISALLMQINIDAITERIRQNRGNGRGGGGGGGGAGSGRPGG